MEGWARLVGLIKPINDAAERPSKKLYHLYERRSLGMQHSRHVKENRACRVGALCVAVRICRE